MTKRAEDGIVYVQTKLCVGCKACIQACPWNVPVMNKVTKKVFKCDFCMDRLDQGLKPACVNGCTAHALDFLETSSVTYNKREAPVLGLLLQKHRALQQ
jgi:Fe-S-cluster-containing dehydrogenase component